MSESITPEVQFILINIDDFNRNNFLKNAAKSATICDVIAESGLYARMVAEKATVADVEKFKNYGPQILSLANGLPNNEADKKWLLANRKLAATYCLNGKFRHTMQTEAAVTLIKKVKLTPLDEATLDKECGVGA
jgi:Glutaminyl-tRNA synthetase, non-specific RNA binding region part 1